MNTQRKKIMVLCSSPRKKGNTNTVVGWFTKAAVDTGAEVECIDVAHLDYKVNGCTACLGCQKSDKFQCVIKDEASDILARIPEVDVLIFASPIYFFGCNAQLKLILDRLYCLYKFDPATGEFSHNFKENFQLALIATAGGPAGEGLDFTDHTCKAIAEFTKFGYESLLFPSTPYEQGKIQDNEEIKQKALEFGKKLSRV